MTKLNDDWPDKDGGTFEVRECPFCHKPPREITHMQHPAVLGSGEKIQSRAVKCGTSGCCRYGPIRDSAAEAVQAWNAEQMLSKVALKKVVDSYDPAEWKYPPEPDCQDASLSPPAG